MDEDLHGRINQLVAEERKLRKAHLDGSGLTDDERVRMRRLEEQLDQAWDLLRQRDARRDAGQDPSAAAPRSPVVVENYWN